MIRRVDGGSDTAGYGHVVGRLSGGKAVEPERKRV